MVNFGWKIIIVIKIIKGYVGFYLILFSVLP